MIKGQTFSLSVPANPSYTIQAGSLSLDTFAACVVENRGPGAVNVYPTGSASGPPLEIVGAYQRKYIMLGGVDTVCFAIAPFTGPVQQSTLYANVAFCDDYSLSGTPDYARGATAVIECTVIPETYLISATDIGFDRIRGILIPAQPNNVAPPEVFMTGTKSNGTANLVALISEIGATLNIALASCTVIFPASSTLILSDQPIKGDAIYG